MTILLTIPISADPAKEDFKTPMTLPISDIEVALESAIAATKQAFPQGKIICSMDKKAFRGWQRQAIRDYLSDVEVPLLTTKQIVEALGKKTQAS